MVPRKLHLQHGSRAVENATRICNLDAVNITLSKLQGALLNSTFYLEGKKTSAGRKLSWSTLKHHLTANYLEIPYDMHAKNVYDTLR